MRPGKLSICGWGPYRGLVEIDFHRFDENGLFLITGATGAGKTTIFDAITYALYGALSGEVRDKERSNVRSDFADGATPTYVELTMEHGGKQYRIYRNPEYLRPKKRGGSEGGFTKEKENAVLYEEDGRITEGVKEVNALLYEILGLDVHQFKQISMIAQGEFARLLIASPKDKTKIFREIFSTGIYEKFAYALSQRAKEKYTLVAEQKTKLEADVQAFLAELSGMPIEEEKKEQFVAVWRESTLRMQELKDLLVQLEAQLQDRIAGQEEIYLQANDTFFSGKGELQKKLDENKRILRYKNVKAQRAQLEERATQIDEAKKRLTQAQNAVEVENAKIRREHAYRSLEGTRAMLAKIETEMCESARRLQEREAYLANREEIEAYLAKREELFLQKKQEADLGKELLALADTMTAHQDKYVFLEEVYKQRKEEYDDLFSRWRRETVGIVAKLLKEGEPCPVCGSVTHPAPAKASEGSVSEERVEEAESACNKAREAMNGEYEILLLKKGQNEEMAKRRKEMEEHILRLAEAVEKEQLNIPEEFVKNHYADAVKLLQKYVEEIRMHQATVSEKKNMLKELSGTLDMQQKEWERAKEDFSCVLAVHGFADEEAYEKARMEKAKRESLAREITDYEENLSAVNHFIASWEETLSSKEEHNVEALSEMLAKAEEDRDVANTLLQKLYAAAKDTHRLIGQLEEKETLLKEATEEYGFVKELENIATGANPKKLVFEQYVLASYFEEILRAANLRFLRMTSGRYEMRRNEEVSDGRVKDNLEIEVMDYYTGKARSVRTLSGGETFKASLCLALGLSDVISSMSGGLYVDTLFIDEGFGALDSESLDQACSALQGLVENRRMIGIISHVPELRERISRQLVIEKTGAGSNVKIVS